MKIPDFPQFVGIDLVHRDEMNTFFTNYPLEASEYTFTNLFAYRDTYAFQLSVLKGNVIILKDTEPVSLFAPLGNTEIGTALDDALHYLHHQKASAYIERVPESFVNSCLRNREKFEVEEERDHFDYLYNVRELSELSGRKFHKKKNKANKFRNTYAYKYETLTSKMIGECLEFEDYWCEVRECEKYYGLNKERCAILEMLNNYDSLGLRGGIIRVDGKIAALTLGEKMLDDTLVIHIEKAHAHMTGLYQVINQEFLIHEAPDCTFVNREQDLGIPGLRDSKLSYNPVRFVKKYRVTALREE